MAARASLGSTVSELWPSGHTAAGYSFSTGEFDAGGPACCNPFEEERSKTIETVDDPVDPFLNEVGVLTPHDDVYDSNRGGQNQNCRDNAEERKNDQHLPSNCAPGFSCSLKQFHWLSKPTRIRERHERYSSRKAAG